MQKLVGEEKFYFNSILCSPLDFERFQKSMFDRVIGTGSYCESIRKQLIVKNYFLYF